MTVLKKTFALMSLTAISGLGSMNAQADCGMDEVIKIAEMSWLSAATLAQVESRIIEEGYGCETQLIPGDTVPTATTMVRKGLPHIAPEMWSSNTREILDEGVDIGAIEIVGDAYTEGGVDAWWIPRYVVEEHPELKSAADLARYAHLFQDPNDPNKGRFYNCPPGWACEVVTRNLIKGYGLDEHYNLFSPGSGAALDAAISSNYLRRKPIAFVYWGPSALLGKYDMVKLDMPKYDPERDACNTQAHCENPSAGNFADAAVETIVVSELQKKVPDIHEFLTKVSFDNAVVNQLLAWGDERNAEPAELAEHFLSNYEDLWMAWVPVDVAERVKAGL